MDYKFKLLKMHCAGCALALEQHINSIEGVSAEINFVTKSLFLKIDTENPAETLTKVKIAIAKFDHQVEIVDFDYDDSAEKKEQKERLRKLVMVLSSFTLLLLGMAINVLWIKITLLAVAYLFAGFDVLLSAAKNIASGKVFDENFLMSIASLGAFVIGEYFEAVCVMLLFDVGELFEELAVGRSKSAIKALLEIKQPYANLVLENGEEKKVDLKDVKIGDKILVKVGERVPLDGKVLSSTTSLDMSALTGETKERIVTHGDSVLSGSINTGSPLFVVVEVLEKDSTVSKIIDMVQNAQESKAKTEKFISKFSKIYTPTVITLGALIMFVPPIILGFHTFSEFAYRALSFLVVSCPCALVISVPLSYFAGIGSAAKLGIMVKSANFLDALSKVDAVVFDKTGTLTKGEFEVSEIFSVGEKTEDEILELCAYAESFSSHKLAKAIIKTYKEKTHEKSINTAWVDDFDEIAGKGIKANIFSQEVLVGNEKLLKEKDIRFVAVSKPGTVLYVAIDHKFAGYIVVSDTIKLDAKQSIEALKTIKIEDISMSTGDEENAAKAVSQKLGIKNCYFGLLPEDKVLIIKNKQGDKKTVAFVGDGINDAPSLATADVGISMGGLGSDIAAKAADVIIMTDEPSKTATAIKKAKQTRKIVLQNIIGSISIKVLILGLISFGLAGMWLAVFADVGVSLLAVLNSLRTMINKK